MMETKPYNLQSPEQIAKDYGGNKQRIAEAMQMGIVDPTAGVLAGMFIDRMRTAQQQEMAPQQTVAQQVFAPPAPPAPPMGAMPPAAAAPPADAMPPAGLGATPEAAAMGAPPPQMMAPPPAPPMEEAPVGMAAGGLTTLPVPDGMFDEPDAGGYAAGGLVAFANGGSTTASEPEPDTYYGYNFRDPTANLAVRDRLFGVPQTRYADEAEQEFLRRRSPEERRLQRRRDLGQLMAEAGFGMMSGTSPNALQNIGAAMLPALSSANERARERRAEEREIQRGLLDIEAGRNTAAAQRATQALSMQEMGVRGYESATDRLTRAKQAELDRIFRREEREDEQRFRLGLEARADARAIRAARAGGGGGQPSFAEANVTIPGPTGRGGRASSTVIERYRVRYPNGGLGYQFPQLGGIVVNAEQGSNAVAVINAQRYAQARGMSLSADQTGRLMGVYPNGTIAPLTNSFLRDMGRLPPNYNLENYAPPRPIPAHLR